MKNISIFLVGLSIPLLVLAGVQEPDEEILNEARRLWMKTCTSGRTEGKDGDSTVYCKIGTKASEEPNAYTIDVTPAPTAGKQVVFVQPPPVKYNHVISLRGGSSGGQETRIFVLPAKVTHDIRHEDQRDGSSTANKPRLYFLPRNALGREDSGSGPGQGSGDDDRGRDDNKPVPYNSLSLAEVGSEQVGHKRPGPGNTYLPPRTQYQYNPTAGFRG